MRRLGVTATLALVLTGCSQAPPPSADPRPLVLTTFTVLADIAENVAGDHLQVRSILPVGAEVHGFEPAPSDIRLGASADLILDNGLGLEAWFAQFLQDADAPHVVVSEGIETIPIRGSTAANPHAWMSPDNGQIYADNMADAFAQLDPENAADYYANAAAYGQKLEVIGSDLRSSVDSLPPQHRALVTCEGAFSYLARDGGLTEEYIWPVNSEQQATPRQVASVIDFVRANEVPAVFCESTISSVPMLRVAESSGAKFGGVLYVDSLSAADGPVPTYLDLLRYDTELIAVGLHD